MSIVIISGYFKPFSPLLLGFICALCVVWLHFFTFYRFIIPDLDKKPTQTISVTVLEVISEKSPQWIKAQLVSLNHQKVNQITAPRLFLSVQHEGALNNGDNLTAEVQLKPFRAIKNFSGFDKQLDAFKQRILFKGRVISTPLITRNQNKQDLVNAYRQFVKKLFTGTKLHWLYYALLTGDRSEMLFNEKIQMQRLGLSHLLAISGLHISIVFGFGFFIARGVISQFGLFVSQRFNLSLYYSCFGFILAFFYVYLSDFLVSASRALIMLGCYLLLYFYAKQPMRWRTILYALVIVLLFNPFSVLNPGLYFSFMAVAIIYVMLQKNVEQWSWLNSKLAKLMLIQGALFIGLFPLSAYFFSGVSIAGLLINLVAIAFVGCILMPLLFVSLLLGSIIDIAPLIAGYDLVLHFIYQLLTQFPQQWQWLSVGQFPFAMVVLYYFVLLLLAFSPVKSIAMLPLFIAYIESQLSEQPLWELNVFDVGHGLMVLVAEQNHAFVYDFGPSYFNRFSRVNSVLLPYINENNLVVKQAIVSHQDKDHAGGLNDFIQAGYTASFALFHPKGPQSECLTATRVLHTQVKIESFENANFNNANDNSCVVKVSGNKYSVLLTGDISKRREASLIKQNIDLRSTILISAHHGSKTSSGSPFIAVVKPDVVVHSSAYQGQWQFPNAEVVARFNKADTQQFVTGLDGQVRIKFFHDKLVIETARKYESYWFIKD